VTIYLDHNACTPVDPRVLECFVEVESQCPGNPGSLHRSGRKARAILENARRDIAEALEVDTDHITFVSSGTEANNLVVRGLGRLELPVLLAPLEHPSVLGPAEQRGVVWWDVTSDGRAAVVKPDTEVGLLSLVHAQSELGTVQPVEAAAEIAAVCGVPLHVDLAQSLGRLPVRDVVDIADSLTLSGHKIGGIRGLAVCVCKRPAALRPLVVGGTQEAGRRAGTPSPALAAATALAVVLALEEQENRARAMSSVIEELDRALEQLSCLRLTSGLSLPNTAMYFFESVDGRNLVPALDLAGVEVSLGSACSSGAADPPRILSGMGFSSEDDRRCVRFSADWRATPRDGARAGEIVCHVVRELRRRS